MLIPITKEQYAIYQQTTTLVADAQSRLQLVLSAILAGHGITEGNVQAVTPESIELSDPPKDEKEG